MSSSCETSKLDTLTMFLFLALGWISAICMTMPASVSSSPLMAFEALDILRGREPYTAAEMGKLEELAQPGITFPNLTSIPEVFSFNCQQINQPGYYADTEFGCMVYHRCERDLPIFTFLCPSQKLFNQITLNCDWWYNVQCQMSKKFYDYSNPRLYLGPNVTFLDSDNSLKNTAGLHPSGPNQVSLGPNQLLLPADKTPDISFPKKQLNQGFRLTLGSKGRHRDRSGATTQPPAMVFTPAAPAFISPQLSAVANIPPLNLRQPAPPIDVKAQPIGPVPTQTLIGSANPLGFWQNSAYPGFLPSSPSNQNQYQNQNAVSESVTLPNSFFQQGSFGFPATKNSPPTDDSAQKNKDYVNNEQHSRAKIEWWGEEDVPPNPSPTPNQQVSYAPTQIHEQRYQDWWNQATNISPQQIAPVATENAQAESRPLWNELTTKPADSLPTIENPWKNEFITSFDQFNKQTPVKTAEVTTIPPTFGYWLLPSDMFDSTRTSKIPATKPDTTQTTTPFYDGFFDDFMPAASGLKSPLNRLVFANSAGTEESGLTFYPSKK